MLPAKIHARPGSAFNPANAQNCIPFSPQHVTLAIFASDELQGSSGPSFLSFDQSGKSQTFCQGQAQRWSIEAKAGPCRQHRLLGLGGLNGPNAVAGKLDAGYRDTRCKQSARQHRSGGHQLKAMATNSTNVVQAEAESGTVEQGACARPAHEKMRSFMAGSDELPSGREGIQGGFPRKDGRSSIAFKKGGRLCGNDSRTTPKSWSSEGNHGSSLERRETEFGVEVRDSSLTASGRGEGDDVSAPQQVISIPFDSQRDHEAVRNFTGRPQDREKNDGGHFNDSTHPLRSMPVNDGGGSSLSRAKTGFRKHGVIPGFRASMRQMDDHGDAQVGNHTSRRRWFRSKGAGEEDRRRKPSNEKASLDLNPGKDDVALPSARHTAGAAGSGYKVEAMVGALAGAKEGPLEGILEPHAVALRNIHLFTTLFDELGKRGRAKLAYRAICALDRIYSGPIDLSSPPSLTPFHPMECYGNQNKAGIQQFAGLPSQNGSSFASGPQPSSSSPSPCEPSSNSAQPEANLASARSGLRSRLPQTESTSSPSQTDSSSTLTRAESDSSWARAESSSRRSPDADTWQLGMGRFTHVMRVLAKAGELGLAVSLLERMWIRGAPPDSVTYNFLLLAYCNAGKVREAEVVLEHMRKSLRGREHGGGAAAEVGERGNGGGQGSGTEVAGEGEQREVCGEGPGAGAAGRGEESQARVGEERAVPRALEGKGRDERREESKLPMENEVKRGEGSGGPFALGHSVGCGADRGVTKDGWALRLAEGIEEGRNLGEAGARGGGGSERGGPKGEHTVQESSPAGRVFDGSSEGSGPAEPSRGQSERQRRPGGGERVNGSLVREFLGSESERPWWLAPTLVPYPDVGSYNIILGSYSGTGDWRRAEAMLAKVEEDGVAADYLTFTKVIEACEKGGQWQRCLRHLASLETSGCHLEEYPFSRTMRALGNAGHWEQARALLARMRQLSTAKPNVQTYDAFLHVCGKSGRWGEALEALDWMREDGVVPHEITFNLLIRICRKAGQWEKALEVFSSMQAAGVPSSPITLTEAIMAYSSGDMAEQAVALLERARRTGAAMDAQVYNAAMAAAARGKRWRAAHQCWRALLADGCTPTESSYRVMLDVLGKSRRLGEALQLFEQMQTQGIQPKVETFNVLLDACASQPDMQRAMELLASLERRGLLPDRVTFNTALKAAHRCRQGARAVELYRQMGRSNIRPDGSTISAYLPALEVCGLAAEALSLYRSLQRAGLWRGPYVGFWYAKVIGGCVAGGDMRGAMAVYSEMLGRSVEPCSQIFLNLLKGCEMMGDWKRALYILGEYRSALCRSLESQRVPRGTPEASGQREPGVEAYNLAIGACDAANRPHEARSIFSEMQSRGVAPSVATYAVVVRALQNGGLWDEAMEVYNSIPLSRKVKSVVDLGSGGRRLHE